MAADSAADKRANLVSSRARWSNIDRQTAVPSLTSSKAGHCKQDSIQQWLISVNVEDARTEHACEPTGPLRRNASTEDDLALGVEASLYGKPTAKTVQEFLRHSLASAALPRWNSLTSAASAQSGALSVMDVLNLWHDDPEELLLDLGFGAEEPDITARIPARFINHQSQARGINVQVFLEAQKNRMDVENPDVSNRFRQLEVLQQVTTAFSSLVGASAAVATAEPVAGPVSARERRKRLGMLLRRASKKTLSQAHASQDPPSPSALPAGTPSRPEPPASPLPEKRAALKRARQCLLDGAALGPLVEEQGPASETPEPREGVPRDHRLVTPSRGRSLGEVLESFELEEIQSFDEGSAAGSYTCTADYRGGSERTSLSRVESSVARTNSCQSDSSGFLEEPIIPSLPHQQVPGPELMKVLNAMSGDSQLRASQDLSPFTSQCQQEAPHNTNLTPETPHSTNLTPEAPRNTNLTPEAPHNTNLTPEAPHNTNLTPEAPHNTNLTPEAQHNTNLTPETQHNTNLTPEAPHNTNLTPEAQHNTNLTPEAQHNTNLTPETQHNTNLTPEAPHNTNLTPEAQHNTKLTPEAPHNTNLTPEAPHSTNLTSEAPHSTNLTSEAPHSTNLTSEAPHRTNLTPEAPHSTNLTPGAHTANTEAPHNTNLTPEAPNSTNLTPEAPNSTNFTPEPQTEENTQTSLILTESPAMDTNPDDSGVMPVLKETVLTEGQESCLDSDTTVRISLAQSAARVDSESGALPAHRGSPADGALVDTAGLQGETVSDQVTETHGSLRSAGPGSESGGRRPEGSPEGGLPGADAAGLDASSSPASPGASEGEAAPRPGRSVSVQMRSALASVSHTALRRGVSRSPPPEPLPQSSLHLRRDAFSGRAWSDSLPTERGAPPPPWRSQEGMRSSSLDAGLLGEEGDGHWEGALLAGAECCCSCRHGCGCCSQHALHTARHGPHSALSSALPYSLDELEGMMRCMRRFRAVLTEIEERLEEEQATVFTSLSDAHREEVQDILELRAAVKQEARQLELQLSDLVHHYDDSIKMKMNRLLDEQSLLCTQLSISPSDTPRPGPASTRSVASQCSLLPSTDTTETRLSSQPPCETEHSPAVPEPHTPTVHQEPDWSPTGKPDKLDFVAFIKSLKNSLHLSISNDSLE